MVSICSSYLFTRELVMGTKMMSGPSGHYFWTKQSATYSEEGHNYKMKLVMNRELLFTKNLRGIVPICGKDLYNCD